MDWPQTILRVIGMAILFPFVWFVILIAIYLPTPKKAKDDLSACCCLSWFISCALFGVAFLFMGCPK